MLTTLPAFTRFCHPVRSPGRSLTLYECTTAFFGSRVGNQDFTVQLPLQKRSVCYDRFHVFLGEAEFEKPRTTLKSFQFSHRPLSAGLRREQSFPPSVIKTSPESTSRRSLCILIGSWNRTPLMLAAAYGHNVLVQKLMGSQAIEINSTDSSGIAALGAAVKYNQLETVRILLSSSTTDIKPRRPFL
jgi:hypothetical protein